MGQKIHPIGFRIGVIRDADSKWYADKQYAAYVLEDFKIRKTIKKRKGWDNAAIAKIEIERQANTIRVTLHTAEAGHHHRRGGAGVDMLKATWRSSARSRSTSTSRRSVTWRPTRSWSPRASRSRSRSVSATSAPCARRSPRHEARRPRHPLPGFGRLGGSEMARREQDRQGKIPLHTLRADIDYGFDEALTQYGHIGVKVWIYKGDILPAPGARWRTRSPSARSATGTATGATGATGTATAVVTAAAAAAVTAAVVAAATAAVAAAAALAAAATVVVAAAAAALAVAAASTPTARAAVASTGPAASGRTTATRPSPAGARAAVRPAATPAT
jgi:small subunit ribosomal protein S3